MPRKPYDSLPFLPHLMAEVVAEHEYTGDELSAQTRSESAVRKTEAARARMTDEQVAEFGYLVDQRCRDAYDADAPFIMQCVRAKGNTGRDQLFIWIKHWLAAYLNNPDSLRVRA